MQNLQETELLTALQWGRTFSSAESRKRFRERRRSISCFNGAALFQVRKAKRLSASLITTRRLQWGRTFSSAESKPTAIRLDESAELQWGRTFSSAESFSRSYCPRGMVRLQWGRTFSSAESREVVEEMMRVKAVLQWGRTFSSAESRDNPSRHRSVKGRFNGAALFQVRKGT